MIYSCFLVQILFDVQTIFKYVLSLRDIFTGSSCRLSNILSDKQYHQTIHGKLQICVFVGLKEKQVCKSN